jgi:hypothetical protein
MATVVSVENQIARLEGFRIIFLSEGRRNLRGDKTGIPGFSNRFSHKAPSRMTVEAWKQRRFRHVYPGFNVEVLLADGARARGNTRLSTVRDSYEGRPSFIKSR